MTGRLESLPILALSVHSACNCRCVMCDIWKANAEQREISPDGLARHVDAIRGLHVQRVMLTGGEPLLNRNLWALCEQLKALRIRITLVTTGLLIAQHAANIARAADTVVISLDGDGEQHDAVRRVKSGFARIANGVMALRAEQPSPRLIARSVVQRANAGGITDTIAAAHRMGFDEISFLAADVSSQAFNRPEPWTTERAAEVAVGLDGLAALRASLDQAFDTHAVLFENGFVAGGRSSLERIHQYYSALAGEAELPVVRCNAPWISAVLDTDGAVRPCFFHAAYSTGEVLDAAVNSASAITFRRSLDVATDATCRRCVCSLNLPVTQKV
jgi:MoaA/NifB/PqqE/SkfB family radical SAM enzyme